MPQSSSPTDDLLGQSIAGRYRIISRLGAGGMGVAYRAWDDQLQVPVVVKIPKQAFLEDPAFAERFAREIRLLQGLGHPRIVPIVDVGRHEGLPYVAMRFLPGGSLSDRRLRGDDGKPQPNPPGMLQLWLPTVAEALDHVHANGVVHRDVKPANIFFDAFWNAFLGDFGIAKIVAESDSFDREQTLTATNMGIGTQGYMAPEQFTPKAIPDGRADQYALAVTVYELVTGERPFRGEAANLIVEILTQPPPPPAAGKWRLPESLAAAVLRGLAKQPTDRFGSCREFAAAVLADVPQLADEPGVARLLCPKCNRMLKLPVAAAGRTGKCPRCRAEMMVANDLGALWLLDEQRTRPDHVGAAAGAASVRVVSDEQALAEFTPISSTTSIRRRAAKRRGMLAAILAGGVLLAGGLVVAIMMRAAPKPSPVPSPVQPPSYEEQLQQAYKTLLVNPDSPVANEFVGKHLCFRERDWGRGLPHLARSNAIGLGAMAKQELGLRRDQPADPAGLVRQAEKWWKLAAQSSLNTEESTAAIRGHARDLYVTDVDRLTDPADVDFVNAWLDADRDFEQLVNNRRPPGPVPPPRPDPRDPPSVVVDQPSPDPPAPPPVPVPAPPTPPAPNPVDVARLWGRGSYGGRDNAAKLALVGGGGAETEQAVDRALEWLAAHQLPDGGWSFDLNACPACKGACSDSGRGKAADRCGATSLALLPFLGRGYTHKNGPYKTQIDLGMGFLIRQIQRNGQAYDRGGSMYSQGLAAIVLCECYALTRDRRLKLPAQSAINFIMQAQDPAGGGWRYAPGQVGDTSASGWQVTALRAAHEADLNVNPLTVGKAVRFLDAMQQDGGAAYGYTSPGDGSGTSAVGLLCRMYLGWKRENPALIQGAARLAAIGPGKDLYFDYYTTQVLWHLGGDPWAAWNDRMKVMLLRSQAAGVHEVGSWHAGVDGGHGAEAAGRLYCTTLAALILETYYRHRPLFDVGP